jgi:hypothetical protein
MAEASGTRGGSARTGKPSSDGLLALDHPPLVHATALHRALRHVRPRSSLGPSILRGAATLALEIIPSEAPQ